MQNTKSTPLNQLFLILTINKLQRKLRKQPHIQELPKRTKYSEIKQVVTLKTIKYLWKKLKKTLINEDTLSSRIRLPTVVKTSQSSLQIQCSSSSVSRSVMSDSATSLTDFSSPGSSVHGILKQEYWTGLTFPSPEDLSDPGIEARSPAL